MKTDVIINRDALYALRELPSESVNCCVTSPPYYGLRDYGLDAQIGREDTPEQYIDRLVEVFRELRRVLKDDGTFWLNIADTYCGTGMKAGCKQKDLIGIPWQLAFALRSDGWYLRSDIIWLKENPMPESCRDRPSRCYEHIFLLTKSKKYYYDAAAIAEPIAPGTAARYRQGRGAGHKYAEEIPGQGKVQGINKTRSGGYYDDALMPTTRNKRDVWLILMILKYLVLGDQKQPQLNSHKMETFCQEIQGILADSNKLNQYVEFACKIISDQVGDLSNAENAKTALITDKLKNAAMVVKL